MTTATIAPEFTSIQCASPFCGKCFVAVEATCPHCHQVFAGHKSCMASLANRGCQPCADAKRLGEVA